MRQSLTNSPLTNKDNQPSSHVFSTATDQASRSAYTANHRAGGAFYFLRKHGSPPDTHPHIFQRENKYVSTLESIHMTGEWGLFATEPLCLLALGQMGEGGLGKLTKPQRNPEKITN